ncbi:hypothetical protein IPZ58_07770 [Streptomyces roseoverticillatus]|uniref:hypothetical protein n=1 Tax=Streptomyces roseoverticillatus TaxID=66429 RepID=UPI001F185B29|nr:hypothetical protein [Streptomyces roseoverticillatus]MCF3101476.1 hypothetical protein [Streptomyces roseoverticillatus]
MKRATAPAAVLLLLAATLTACSDTPDDCGSAAPMAALAAPELLPAASKGDSRKSTSKPKPAKTKAKSKAKAKKHKHHSHDDIDICEDDD